MSIAEILAPFREEITDRLGPKDLAFPDDWPMVEEHIRKRSTGEVASLRYELRGVRKDGTVIRVEVYGSRAVYRGKPAVISTLLDITDRRRAEEALKKSATLLLAEDNADIRTVTSDMLRMSGYTLIEAVNGREAVERFREHQGRYN